MKKSDKDKKVKKAMVEYPKLPKGMSPKMKSSRKAVSKAVSKAKKK